MVKSTTVKALALITFVSFLGLIALHQSLKFSAFSNAGKYLRQAVLADEPVKAAPNGGFGNGYAETDNNGVTEFQQEEDDEDRDVKGENDKEEEEEEDDDDDDTEEENDNDDREEESDHDAEDREDEEEEDEENDEEDDDGEDDEEDDNDGKDDKKDDDDEDNKQEPKEEPVLPKRKRLPKALIIGFSKCGTTALRTFLALHPDIVSPIEEVRYFNYNYSKGLEWYRNQMPPSTEKQITIEKTPSYIMSPLVLQRIYQYNPKIKLIIIIRDPIIRLQSQFAHTFRNAPPNAHIPDFKNWCKGDTTDKRIIHFVGYTTYIRQVYDQFAREQVLVLAEEDFEQNPLSVMKEVEVFLGLKPAFNKDMFYFNRSKGFYCFNRENEFFPTVLRMVKVNNRTGCLGEDKGRDHPEISPEFQKELVQYVRPHNEQLFKLIGKRIIWENFE